MNPTLERESDGPLPRWWRWGLGLSIALATSYWLCSEAFHLVPEPLERYLAERAAALDTGEAVTDQMLVELARDKLAVRAGAADFGRHCAKCHGAGGEGGIGPNLTDDVWIASGSPLDIYRTIVFGRDGKGMPSWGLLLGTGACKQLAAHVLTFRQRASAGPR